MATGRVPTTANSPLTAKGDLFGYSTTQARVPVGSDGETIVADSSTSTGLRYQAPKTQNAIYNSGFDIAQRGTSFTGLSGFDQTLDRWVIWATTASQSNYASQQTAGNLSVSPTQAIRYCGRFGRTAGTTNTGGRQIIQTLETSDSIRFTGQIVTMSFYARAGANYSNVGNLLEAFLSSGTSTDVSYPSFTSITNVATSTVTLTTSWQRFSITGTVGTSVTQLAARFIFAPTGTAGAADYLEVTGVQLEVGSVATPYNRMSGTIQGELAACQRYYYKTYQQGVLPATVTALGSSDNITGTDGGGNAVQTFRFPVTMRTNPTITTYRQDGTSGSWNYARSGASGTGATTVDTFSDAAIRFYLGTGANWTLAQTYGHLVAQAEL